MWIGSRRPSSWKNPISISRFTDKNLYSSTGKSNVLLPLYHPQQTTSQCLPLIWSGTSQSTSWSAEAQTGPPRTLVWWSSSVSSSLFSSVSSVSSSTRKSSRVGRRSSRVGVWGWTGVRSGWGVGFGDDGDGWGGGVVWVVIWVIVGNTLMCCRLDPRMVESKAPVPFFFFFGRIDDWTDGYRWNSSWLVLFVRSNEAYRKSPSTTRLVRSTLLRLDTLELGFAWPCLSIRQTLSKLSHEAWTRS